ncbi:MAG: hypothetical protein AAF569_07400 [Pseudomonadota bacterium]
MCEPTLATGILIGSLGGFFAGIGIAVANFLARKFFDHQDTQKILNWLKTNTSEDKFRSTKAISSWCNLTQDRVRELCSSSKEIRYSVGEKEDRWTLT